MTQKKLNELFDEVRQRNLKEDFQVGQAALALRELQKSAQAFSEFVNGPFAQSFKALHNDPRGMEALGDLVKQLDAQKEQLTSVADEVNGYLYDFQSENNPDHDMQDLNRDAQDRRRTRWSRWEHRTPRHKDRD